MTSYIPPGKQQFFDANGNPLAGGSVYTYVPATTTPKATYQDLAGATPNSNPITLDANGECIINGTGAYRQQVYDALGNLIWDQITSTTQLTDINDNSTSGTPASIGYLAATTSATAPTMTSTDNSTHVATTAFVTTAIANNAVVVLPLYGLLLSYSSGTVYGIASGGAMSDDALTFMVLASAFTKTLASWAAGSGNGSLDTGTVAIGTFYHIYLIYNPTSKVTDILASTSASSPTMPSGYTKKVKIGAILNKSSGVIASFTQIGNDFIYTQDLNDAATTIGSATGAFSLTVPPGLKLTALYRCNLSISNAGSACALTFLSPDDMTTPASGNYSLQTSVTPSGGTVQQAAGEFRTRTNTSGQINIIGAGYASAAFSLWTYGFVYPRGLT